MVHDLFRGQEETADCAESKAKLGERYKKMKSSGQSEKAVLLI